MSTADHILDQIDQALGDSTVGPDAMRSQPAPEPPSGSPVFHGTTPTLQIMDEVGEWHEVQGVVHLDSDQTLVNVTVDTTAIVEQFDRLLRQVDAFAETVAPRVAEAGQAIARGFETLKQAGVCDDHGLPLPPRDRPAWQSRYGPARQRRRR
ncbi:hypothetical protein AB0D91_05385 [Streptomyces canus]|uniref:hypothetical protein n=1 Tax=Streptomyces canus TaxID=58343 RepID=UPI0033E8B0C6